MAPQQAPAGVVDATLRFVARTLARLALIQLEDALGSQDQPNVPGTIDEHPNWRRRFKLPADQILQQPAAEQRLRLLNGRRS